MEEVAEVFSDLIGQGAAKRWLTSCLSSGNLPQALIFAGPEGVGRKTAAKLVAEWLHNQGRDIVDASLRSSMTNKTRVHPDTFWYSQVWREMKEHGSDEEKKSPWMHTAHAMIRFLEMSPLSSKYKVAIVDDGEKLTEIAQNALLKTFEEPRGDSVIIFIVPNEEVLLPTIVSRAQVVRFGPLSHDEIKQVVPEASDEQIKASGGSVGLVKNWAEMPAEWERAREVREFWKNVRAADVTTKFQWAMRFKERDEAVDFIKTGIQVWRGMLPDGRVAEGLERMQMAVQQIRDNVNLRAALDTLLLAL